MILEWDGCKAVVKMKYLQHVPVLFAQPGQVAFSSTLHGAWHSHAITLHSRWVRARGCGGEIELSSEGVDDGAVDGDGDADADGDGDADDDGDDDADDAGDENGRINSHL